MLSGQLGDPRVTGRVEATLPDVGRLPVTAAPNLRQAGQLTLTATVSGTARNPAIDGQLTGEALSLAGQRFNRLDAAFNVAGQTARVASLTLAQDAGSLTASGSYDWRTHAVNASAAATNLSVSPVPGTRPGEVLLPLDARLSGEWQSAGTLDAPQGSGRVELDETKFGDRDLGRVAARLTLAERRLQAAIDLADLYTTGTAALSLDAPGSFVVDAQTTDADLLKIAGRLGVTVSAPVAGAATLATHVEGAREDLAHARTTVDLQRFDGMAGSVPVRTAQPARASYDGRVLDVTDLTVQVGAGRLHAPARIGNATPGTLAASFDGDVRDLQQLARSFLPADSAATRVRADGTSTSTFARPGRSIVRRSRRRPRSSAGTWPRSTRRWPPISRCARRTTTGCCDSPRSTRNGRRPRCR